MGFFDRFKGNNDSMEAKQQDKKININKGRTQIEFKGLKDIDGKILACVVVTYLDEQNQFKQGEFLVEPRLVQDDSGKLIDTTEQYYREMAANESTEEKMQYFFDEGAIMPTAHGQGYGQGSNYIGGFEFHKDGSWSRNYDVDFREKYRDKARQREQEIKREFAEKHAAETKATIDYVKEKEQIGKKNQDIYRRMQEGRASNEEVAEYYRHVNVKNSGVTVLQHEEQ